LKNFHFFQFLGFLTICKIILYIHLFYLYPSVKGIFHFIFFNFLIVETFAYSVSYQHIMKFLEIASLAQINAYLTNIESFSGDSRIFGHIEAYSCKRAGSDKKLFNSLEEHYQLQLSKSPDFETATSTSPFGPLSEKSSRKTLIYLISTLNSAFPDYDFSNARAEQFRKEASHYMLINYINTSLSNALGPQYISDLAPKLWSALDTEIVLKDCDIYSYTPDTDSDPYAEDGNATAIWSFHYFFYNKKLRRIVYFTCRALSIMAVTGARLGNLSEDDDHAWMNEDDDQMQFEM